MASLVSANAVLAQPRPPVPAGTPDQAAVAAFVQRVETYVALHRKLEDAAPKLPDDATPQQIAQRERVLGEQITVARATARPGDIFTPAMATYTRQLFRQVLSGRQGQRLRAAIMDENVAELTLRVNQQYPTKIPLTTMPTAVLMALPQLPEDLEYRVVARSLILLDPHAGIVVDFVPNVMTAR